jgi:CMD domain protein
MATTPDSPASTAVSGSEPADAIDQMAGVAPDSAAARARAARPEVVRAAQGSYLALLAPDDPGGLSLVERALIALRVARLTPSAPATAFYRARLARLGAAQADVAAVERFPDGSSTAPRLSAILRHTDRLTTAPRTATPAHLADLKAAGLAPAEIVTIAQLIALVTFQARVAATLRALGEDA